MQCCLTHNHNKHYPVKYVDTAKYHYSNKTNICKSFTLTIKMVFEQVSKYGPSLYKGENAKIIGSKSDTPLLPCF